MKAKQFLMLIILVVILTACVVAKMPTPMDDSIQLWNPLPTPTLGLLYIEGTVVDPGYVSVYDPYPAPGLPVPYP